MNSNQKVWKDIYQTGHEQKAPWDVVVSFVYSNRPRDKDIQDTNIFEVGCGTASNLRFFAQQGFQVAGLDFSSEAIECAENFFRENNLPAKLSIGSFEDLSDFEDNSYDLVIDRAALTCAGDAMQKKAIDEIYRILTVGGRFLYTPYADTHSSALSAKRNDQGLSEGITKGTLQGVGSIRFMSQNDIKEFFPSDKWKIISMEYETRQNMLAAEDAALHSSWRIVVEKR